MSQVSCTVDTCFAECLVAVYSQVPDMHLFTEKARQIHIVGIMEAGEFLTE